MEEYSFRVRLKAAFKGALVGLVMGLCLAGLMLLMAGPEQSVKDNAAGFGYAWIFVILSPLYLGMMGMVQPSFITNIGFKL